MQVNQSGGGGPTGFPSAPVGFKYNFFRDVQSQFLVSGGVTYFIHQSFQDFPIPGKGDFHFFLSGGKEIFGRGHWLSGTGFRIPVDNFWGTQFWYWSNQWDYEVVDHWYGLVGVNWFHWMSSGANIGSSVTGMDLVSVPASGRCRHERRDLPGRLEVEAQLEPRAGGRFRIPAHRSHGHLAQSPLHRRDLAILDSTGDVARTAG